MTKIMLSILKKDFKFIIHYILLFEQRFQGSNYLVLLNLYKVIYISNWYDDALKLY